MWDFPVAATAAAATALRVLYSQAVKTHSSGFLWQLLSKPKEFPTEILIGKKESEQPDATGSKKARTECYKHTDAQLGCVM